jgi:multicomponent Na+:H+ antiporter subunit E
MNSSSSTSELPAFSWRHYALVFGVSLLLWLLLVGNLKTDEILAGVLVAFLVTLLFGSRFGIFTGFRFSWLAPVYIGVYLGHFLVALLRANIDLARRVLSPSLPIRPQLVEISTGLKSPLGKMLLANTITLTPGTLTVDVVDDRLLVHWVYCPPGTDMQQATQQIAAAFEANLSRFLL